MKREIITIDEEKCTGCELCIPNCPEGAIQIIDEKARLISDLFCDGLGACIGHCPEGAITIEEREAEPYDEKKVPTVESERDIHSGCPGAKTMTFSAPDESVDTAGEKRQSELTHWPVQLHLIPPMAPHFQGKDILLSADCVAYSIGDFHRDFLKGKAVAIACPKLDDGQDIYLDKLVALIDTSKINTLTVMTMEVPCCGGLVNLARQAAAAASRKIPIKSIVISIRGEILSEEWV